MERKIIEAAKKIKALYDTDFGGVGGYGHIVFDDDNIETENVEWCISQAKEKTMHSEVYGACSDWLPEETRLASIEALEFILDFTEKERQEAINYYFNEMR